MPSIQDQKLVRARVSNPGGAGGEPLGETPATPSEILGQVPEDIRRQLPEDVVDELLAGARSPGDIASTGRRKRIGARGPLAGPTGSGRGRHRRR